MSKTLNLRLVVVIAVVVWAVYSILPNFFPIDKQAWWLSKDRLKYGLDIQGGLHLVMGVDVQGVLREQTSREAQTIKKRLEEEKIGVQKSEVTGENGLSIALDVTSPEDAQKTKDFINKSYPTLISTESNGTHLVFSQSESYITRLQENAIDQAVETLRNRIDEFGVAEPSITKQGTDRILVQLPLQNIADVDTAKNLISRTARLEFHIVSQGMTTAELTELVKKAEDAGKYKLDTMKYSEYVDRINKDLVGKIPENTFVRFARDERVKDIKEGKIAYLLDKGTNLGGESLTDAGVTFGQFNEPEVSLTFNAEGAKRFEDVTGANKGRQMAIVLDDVVYSAPNIKDRIAGGRAVISLGRGDRQAQMNEANTISMALRSGALPARLEQLEERTIGPSLGQDSIRAGIHATYIGAALIVILMLVWYRQFGLIANIALALNAALILAVLTALDATLTLPGIAGLALTLGMAVDANVIINERIKDELRKGASFAAAVREGYSKAMSAILDGNITTIAVSAILFHFGTGPVRGFAITLIIGLLASMFTAIFVTRTVIDFLMLRYNVQSLSIGSVNSVRGTNHVQARA